MKSISRKTIAALAVIIFGFAAIFFLSNSLEKIKPALPENYADADLSLQGAKIKGFTLGSEGLIADWYWMQSLQYVGDKIYNFKGDISIDNLKPLNPRLLYPYLDTATDLDPKFSSVYEYGAVVLPAIDHQLAVKIVEKGIANDPENYKFYHHLGYIYWRAGEFEKASEVYARGAKMPNAPPFMQMMAARMKSEGGNRETAREIYRQMAEQAEDKQVKENAELRLLELDALEEQDAIRAALKTFLQKNNRCVNNLQEILPLLRGAKLPGGKDFRLDKSSNLVDPTGAPYVLDAEKCDVALDREKTKIPL